jgi:hypothetical protein
MKKIVLNLFLILVLISLSSPCQVLENKETQVLTFVLPIKKKIKKDITVITNQKFLSILGHMESGNDYKVVNAYGYIGKYQFGQGTLTDLGINISLEDFKIYPDSIFPSDVQDVACIRLMRRNKSILKKHMTHVDSVYKNIRITQAGLLASAHLVGAGSVMIYLDSKGETDPVDGNGTPLSLYMTKFQNVEIKL